MPINKRINKKLINYKLCFGTVVLLLAWLGVIFLIVLPALSSLKQKSSLLEDRFIDEKEKDRKIEQFPILKKQFQEFNNDRNHLEEVLFDEKDIVKLVRELEEIAVATNNNIDIQVENNIDKKEIVNKKKKTKEVEEKLLVGIASGDYFTVNIILHGDYKSFLRFIYKLENMPYYNNVIKFELKKQTEDDKKQTNSRYQSNTVFFAIDDNDIKDELIEEEFSLVSKVSVVFYLKNRDIKK